MYYNKVQPKGVNKMKNGQRIFNLFIFALMILGMGHIDLLITGGDSNALLPYHMGACLIAFIASLLTLRESFRAIVGK